MQEARDGIVLKTEEYVAKLFRERSGRELPFHNFDHTAGVVSAAREIGEAEGLSADELEVVTIAAWLHDVGYFEVYKGHEEKSAEMARTFLQESGYDADRIDTVVACILSTQFPPRPSNQLEKVICDADMAHLGREHVEDRNRNLRRELADICNRHFTDEEWLQNDVRFLRNQEYHTDYARRTFGPLVEQRKKMLEDRLRERDTGGAGVSEEAGEADLSSGESRKNKKLKKLKKELAAIRKELDQQLGDNPEQDKGGRSASARLDRGIETMFRTTSRNHIDLSAMADSKANIMISVNSIIISIVASLLPRTLERDPHFTIPAIMLLTVCLTTIVMAIIATRPKVSSGMFTQEDIRARKVNLLFFGNFHSVSLEDYEQGVTAMMNDAEYLYGSMIKDIYFLGKVLGRKYKYLRFSYNVFMYGLILSVIAFVVAILHH